MGSFSALGLGFAGLGVLESGLSGLGQYESGQEQRAAYDYNADVALERMRQQEQTSQAKYSNLIAKQATAYAAAGVDVSSGSPLLMMAHAAAQSALEQTTENQAGTQEAALERYYGNVAAFSGTIGGIGTFLSGLTKGGLQATSILGPGGSG